MYCRVGQQESEAGILVTAICVCSNCFCIKECPPLYAYRTETPPFSAVFQLHGVMRIVYKPLISSIPIIGGMQLFFLNNPDIDFNMLGVADVLDMPGLR